MMRRDKLLPITSVTLMPRWVLVVAMTFCGGCIAAGIVLILVGLLGSEGSRAGYLGGGGGCVIGGLGGAFGTWMDWRRRPDPVMLLTHLRGKSIVPMAKASVWAGLLLTAIGALLYAWQGGSVAATPLLMGGTWFVVGLLMRGMAAHLLRRARAVFTLYAEGVLEPRDAAAIEDARQKDPEFDRQVREHQRVNETVRSLFR